MIVMACKTSGDSSRRVPVIIFWVIQDSFTTQGLLSKPDSSNPTLTSLESGEASLTAPRFDEAPK